jgi:cytochrome b
VFHWALALSVIGLVITGNVGGNAMVWHFRLGYCVGSLLIFRISDWSFLIFEKIHIIVLISTIVDSVIL